MSDAPYQYWAFISYSHVDSRVAAAVHRWLERYTVPRRLRGRATRLGSAPARLSPVFRDREELPSSSELGGAIRQALAVSRYLIVVCSPAAARSRWVDEEIAHFKALGRADRILALVIDGDPGARDPQHECFPPSLRSGADPIAADARKDADGEQRARMKLVAGILEVGLDELLRRHRQHELRRRAAWAVGAVALAGAMAGGLLIQQQNYESRARSRLMTSLVDEGQRELLADQSMRAAVLLAQAYQMGDRSTALRFMLHQALQPTRALRRVIDGKSAGLNSQTVVSGDGGSVVAFGADHRLHRWSLADGKPGVAIPVPRPGGASALVCGPSLSGDGRRAALMTSISPTLPVVMRVWDTSSGRLLQRMDDAIRPCRYSSPLSADGRKVIRTGPDAIATVRDLDSGDEVRLPDAGEATFAAFDDRGEIAAVGNSRGEVSLWRIADWSRQQVLTGLPGAVSIAVIAHDGSGVAASTDSGALRYWRLPDGKPTLSGGHSQIVRSISLSDDGQRLLSIADDGMRVWRTRDGALLYADQITLTGGVVATMRPDGRQIVRVDHGRASVVDVDSARVMFSLDAQSLSAEFLRGSQALLTSGENDRISVWDPDFRPQAQAAHDEQRAWAPKWWPPSADVALVPGAGLLASGGLDGHVRLWAQPGLAPRGSLGHFDGAVPTVTASGDGRWVAAGTANGHLAVWDLRGATPPRRLEMGERFVSVLRLSRDGSRLLAVGNDGDATLWNLADGTALAEFTLDIRFATAISADDRYLALGMDRKLRVLDLQTLETLHDMPIGDIPADVGCIAFSADSTRLFAMTRSAPAQVLMVGLKDGAEQRQVLAESEGCLRASFDTGGQRVLILERKLPRALIWQPATQRLVKLWPNSAMLFDTDWSPDGQLVATGSYDGVVKLWDAETGLVLREIGYHAARVRTVRFGPDGHTLFTAGGDNRVQAWNVALESAPPAQVAELLRCAVPWRWTPDGLERVMDAPQHCALDAP